MLLKKRFMILACGKLFSSSNGFVNTLGSKISFSIINRAGIHASIHDVESINEKISQKGDYIRKMKESGMSNHDLKDEIAELLLLKEKLKQFTEKKNKSLELASAPERIKEPTVYFSSNGQMPKYLFGDYQMIASRYQTSRMFIPISKLKIEEKSEISTVWIRGRIQNIRAKGNNLFAVLRGDRGSTVQLVKFQDKRMQNEDSKALIKYISSLPLESVVDIYGTLVPANVKSCTQADVEVQIERAYTVSRADSSLQILVEDAARSEKVIEESQKSERPFPRLGQEIRLDNRWIDLRTPANQAIMQIQSGICQLFREYLYSLGFIEIHTPKLVAGESEGGSEVFKTDYFGAPACLAQSPQIHKQIAISSDMERVFEIGPVFRAENSNTRRHLCEFTGLDIEMAITDHYDEILVVLHGLFKHMFTELEARFLPAIETVRKQYESSPVVFSDNPCVIHWPHAIKLLRDAGIEVSDFDDLSGVHELELGRIVKDIYGTDFFIVDQYPSSIRPFYTMPNVDDKRFSNSFDLFLRGQEICSGAQRIHHPELLEQKILEKGVNIAALQHYISSFKTGCPPHGGAGVGLERVLFLYLGLDNIRKASMFPRDPRRCIP